MTIPNQNAAARRQGILLMIVCSVMWSIAGIFIKLIPWHPLAIASVRSLLAGLVVLCYILKRRIPFRFNRVSLLAGLGMMGTFLSFVSANKLTTAANAIVLQFTSPVFLLILAAVIYRQKFRKGDVAVVVVTLGGISLFFLDQLSPGSVVGNCLGIFAGFCLAVLYTVSGNCDEETRMSGIMLGQIMTAVAGAPFLFLTDTPVSPTVVGSLVALGIVQLGIPYVLFGLAIGKCPPLACSLIGALEPLLNPVWVFLFDGEAPGIFALMGGVVVVAAVTIWCIWDEKGKERAEEAWEG